MEKKNQDVHETSHIDQNNSCNGKMNKLGGWGFIQTLCNTYNDTKLGTTETEQIYVHPLVKRNLSSLSSKSLEMCTESLGSETGSDISENSDEFASMLIEAESSYGRKPDRTTKKFNRKVELPPPLSSISGGDGVRVTPHREGGRLVLEAVIVPPCNKYFQAERVGGRLRLSFLKNDNGNDNDSDDDSEESDSNGDNQESSRLEGEDDAVEEGNCNCKGIDDGEEDDDGNDRMEMKNDGKIGCEIELAEFKWFSRCKEGGNRKEIRNCWEPCCLAIS